MKIVNIIDDGTTALAHAYDEQGNTLDVATTAAMLATALSSYIEHGYEPEDRHAVATALTDMLLHQHTPPVVQAPGDKGQDDEEEP